MGASTGRPPAGVVEFPMADNELDTLHIVKPTDRRPRWQRRPRTPYKDIPDNIVKTPLKRTVTDYADVMGIPRRELTPAVQAALDALHDELEHERRELDRAQEHVSALEDSIDSHSFLPIMNRRAFVQQLSQAIEHVTRTGTASTLVLIHLRNAETVRRRQGRRALDSLLALITETLIADSRETDVIGGLGGSDFGIILALADEKGAIDKAAEIKKRLDTLTPTWRGQPLAVEVGVGVRVITTDETVEQVLESADRDLIDQEATEIEREIQVPWEKG